jgi:hypothetical protein
MLKRQQQQRRLELVGRPRPLSVAHLAPRKQRRLMRDVGKVLAIAAAVVGLFLLGLWLGGVG